MNVDEALIKFFTDAEIFAISEDPNYYITEDYYLNDATVFDILRDIKESEKDDMKDEDPNRLGKLLK
jgi:hypothetical protein